MADLDLENFLSKFDMVGGGGGGGGAKNHTWTKNAGIFMKWINALKNFFNCLADLEFFVKVWGGGGGGGGGSKITPEPKLQEISWNG